MKNEETRIITMQTKNINIDRPPRDHMNLNENEHEITLEKTLMMIQRNVNQNFRVSDVERPPLPPRAAIIFSPLNASHNLEVEVEGYGPYKPVPPPKPLPQQPSSAGQQQSGSSTPPPYRMPPYPLYHETSIPGSAAGLEQPVATSSPQGLHTHSSKFPIEREVILSTTDKNSKIPILHDYKKRTKATVAPDAPPKQMAAWAQNTAHNNQILPDQTHSGLIQTIQQSNDQLYRTSYHQVSDYYPQNTGAVPRSNWHGNVDTSKVAPRPFQPPPSEYSGATNTAQSVTVQIESKETPQKEQKNSVTKTYHTIKDIISSRFKSSKDGNEEKEETGLNNLTEETRKSNANEEQEKKSSVEQGIYGKPTILQHQYNQHMIQQHVFAQQAQQQYQQQHLKSQQLYSQQLAQARSQEVLASRHDDQVYYQSYGATPRQTSTTKFAHLPGREQNVQAQAQFINGKDNQKELQTAAERRSAQQLERDNLRQRSFEARRAASQPQLNFNDDTIQNNEIPHQTQITPCATRRGSHGNIMEAATLDQEQEKDSDDGGFLKRVGSRERRLDPPGPGVENNSTDTKEDTEKPPEVLLGTPRKKLEGEIGKIEGVYNVGHRANRPEDDRGKNVHSASNSDYDKTGGQSSSNVDSGRGSAAYSSGRRPPVSELNEETGHVETGGNYRDLHRQSNDPEWVDIVENELRHILEPKLHELSLQNSNVGMANSTVSESISSMTPPLPPLSPGEQSSPNMVPRNRFKHSSLPYGSKPEYEGYKSKSYGAGSRWSSSQKQKSGKKIDHGAILRGRQIIGLDSMDLTSTTTRSLDLESMLDGQSDSDGDLSTTDARTIRKQLEGLETMYSEVLKLLGVNKKHGRYQPSDPRFSKRRYGSMSSLPSSSVSSRPIRDKRRASEERKKVRDIRGVNKRFQRLESHVVTLARSVAHLSSEMRTQHLMIQEMENIRGEISALRTQTNMLNVRSQSTTRAASNRELPTLANPSRVKKLTKFFGDEPPLLRLFLRKLGYEKYASVFENERVGMVELPYLSEDRLQKMGVPLGPRLRIMQEAQISVCKDNTLCIV